MYGNDLIVANESTESREYHVLKEETLNVSILAVSVNGYDFPYHVESGVLALDVQMPADSTMEIHVQYGNRATP
jgi:redox-sensitive bicupin YhaK (pirin superfamily)